jgi:hypothetical protein
VRPRHERVERLRQIGIAQGHALEQVERHRLVVQPDGYEGHVVSFTARDALDNSASTSGASSIPDRTPL